MSEHSVALDVTDFHRSVSPIDPSFGELWQRYTEREPNDSPNLGSHEPENMPSTLDLLYAVYGEGTDRSPTSRNPFGSAEEVSEAVLLEREWAHFALFGSSSMQSESSMRPQLSPPVERSPKTYSAPPNKLERSDDTHTNRLRFPSTGLTRNNLTASPTLRGTGTQRTLAVEGTGHASSSSSPYSGVMQTTPSTDILFQHGFSHDESDHVRIATSAHMAGSNPFDTTEEAETSDSMDITAERAYQGVSHLERPSSGVSTTTSDLDWITTSSRSNTFRTVRSHNTDAPPLPPARRSRYLPGVNAVVGDESMMASDTVSGISFDRPPGFSRPNRDPWSLTNRGDIDTRSDCFSDVDLDDKSMEHFELETQSAMARDRLTRLGSLDLTKSVTDNTEGTKTGPKCLDGTESVEKPPTIMLQRFSSRVQLGPSTPGCPSLIERAEKMFETNKTAPVSPNNPVVGPVEFRSLPNVPTTSDRSSNPSFKIPSTKTGTPSRPGKRGSIIPFVPKPPPLPYKPSKEAVRQRDLAGAKTVGHAAHMETFKTTTSTTPTFMRPSSDVRRQSSTMTGPYPSQEPGRGTDVGRVGGMRPVEEGLEMMPIQPGRTHARVQSNLTNEQVEADPEAQYDANMISRAPHWRDTPADRRLSFYLGRGMAVFTRNNDGADERVPSNRLPTVETPWPDGSAEQKRAEKAVWFVLTACAMSGFLLPLFVIGLFDDAMQRYINRWAVATRYQRTISERLLLAWAGLLVLAIVALVIGLSRASSA